MSGGPKSRIVVTGCGAVTAWGWGVTPFWEGVCGERAAIGELDRFDHTSHLTHLAAQVPRLAQDPAQRSPASTRHSLADKFAIFAAAEALGSARLDEDLSHCDAAVIFGSSTGGMFESEEWYAGSERERAGRSAIPALCSQQVNAPGDAVARRFRASGAVETVSSACSSASLAIGLALDTLRNGDAELAIAGGADSLCRITFGGFNALRAIDERPCRPFREDRSGLTLGEGAGVLVLEPLERARDRGARPLAELIGAGASADAHHMTAPHPEGRGAALALQSALADAERKPRQVDFVNAHGTGTRLNDVSEYRALETVFGSRAREIPVTSTKGSVGHLLGSAGAIEAVATVMCLVHQKIHPTPGAGEVDPAAPVRLVRGVGLTGTEWKLGASLSLGFGGSNAALLFSRWDEA